MFHACVQRFDVTENLLFFREIFLELYRSNSTRDRRIREILQFQMTFGMLTLLQEIPVEFKKNSGVGKEYYG
jgi:hypothetical protein